MPAHRLLYLTAHQVVGYHWHAGDLDEEASFEAGNVDNGFVAYLRGHSSSLFTVVANVAEEGFQVDSIPFLNAADRHIVIDRKLGQMFAGAPLTTAVSRGYEKDRRKNERLLFAALTNASLFAPWLAALRAAEARVAAIYSLPLLSEKLIEALGVLRERCLLISVQDTSIRQTFFSREHLHFSRLSPLTNSSIGGIAQTIASEAAKTQQYLLSQRLLARNDALTVHVLAHPQATVAIAAACPSTDALRFQIHDQHELAARLGLHGRPDDSRCDALFLQIAAARPPRSQFAREPERQHYRLWQIGNGLRMVGAVAFAGCALFAGHELVDIVDLRRAADAAQTAARTADERYQAIARTFPPLPVGNDVLRQLTGRYTEIAHLAVSPAGLYREISRALDDNPQIEVEAIDWRLAATATPTPSAAPRATADGAAFEAATIRGSVQLAGAVNPREILRLFDSFIGQLRSNPQIDVTVDQQPFDLGTEKSLKSSDGAAAPSGARPFSVIVTRKLRT